MVMGSTLAVTTQEKDFGIFVDNSLKTSVHHLVQIKKINKY